MLSYQVRGVSRVEVDYDGERLIVDAHDAPAAKIDTLPMHLGIAGYQVQRIPRAARRGASHGVVAPTQRGTIIVRYESIPDDPPVTSETGGPAMDRREH